MADISPFPIFARAPHMDATAQVAELCEQIRTELETRHIQSRAIENATYSIETLSKAYASTQSPVDWLGYGLWLSEERLANFLHSHMDQPMSVERIMNVLYCDSDDPPEDKVVTVRVCMIRPKLKASPFDIENVRGRGYKMVRRPIPEAAQAALKVCRAA